MPNIWNSALEARDARPAAHSESTLVEFSGVRFSDVSGDLGNLEEILCETFMGKSFLGKRLEQSSEDGSWNWSSRPWERNEEIDQYNEDENKKADFIERNREMVKVGQQERQLNQEEITYSIWKRIASAQ